MSVPRNTTYELIYHFARGNVPPHEIPQVLSTIFNALDYKDALRQVPEQDIVMWVERLDQIIGSSTFPEDLQKRVMRSLRKTCGMRKVLPRSHYFHGRLSKTGNRPFSGGAADVWRVEDDRRRIYAAKVFRVNFSGEEYKIKRYYKELLVWKRLEHPNVLPAFGAAPGIAELCVVCPWMSEGDLPNYLNNHPGADRASIMIGVAEGLSYLHLCDVVHGDMKGPNILFDDRGIPQIADFGECSITFNPTANASTPYHGRTIRWSAPEIIEARNDNSRPTKASDVYSFAMVVIEIFTGNVPFPDLPDIPVHLAIMKGKRPSKPANASKLGLSSSAWKVVEECWNKKQDRRPHMRDVAFRLRRS